MLSYIGQQANYRLWWKATALLLVLAIIASIAPTTAWAGTTAPTATTRTQDSRRIITVSLPPFVATRITDQVIADFEARHPGLTFKVITADPRISGPTSDLSKHFENVEGYVSSADVLYVDSNRLTPESTLAGYYLDLAPLVGEDTTLNPDDFFPAAWKSYQWDKGVWALPVSLNTNILIYEPKAFDDAGLAYPTDQWTMADFVKAAEALTQRDAAGKVTRAGMDFFSAEAAGVFFRSLLGETWQDTSLVPATPAFGSQALEALIADFREQEEAGVFQFSFGSAPLSISPAFTLILPVIAITNGNNNEPTAERKGILLPGSTAGLEVNAFAVSSGTQHPQDAYALAAFLSERPEVAAGGLAVSPARRSLIGQGGANFTPSVSAEAQALITQSVEQSIPVADMRFASYLARAYERIRADKLEVRAALDDAEALANQNQQAAIDKKATVAITVKAPISTTTDDGRAVLNFGLASFFGGGDLPNKDEWEHVNAAFTERDPQIGAVQINQGFDEVSTLLKKNDCVYLPFNAIPNADLGAMLPLDPFVDADPSFDKSDVVGGVLAQVSRDGKLYGYPLVIEPAVLKYDPAQFGRTGATEPTGGWSVSEFNNALRTLKVDPADPAPFQDNGSGGTYLLMLIAAYGGLPLDFRTDPPTVNFTAPETVTAIQEVLDLAKNGYLKYNKLGNFLGAGMLIMSTEINGTPPAISTDNLNAMGFAFGIVNDTVIGQAPDFRYTTYPSGERYTGASYNLGVGLISATSQHPDACYRFFNAITGNPTLFQAMPVRRSQIEQPALAEKQGEALVSFYRQMAAQLADPNTINFPTPFSGGASQTGFLLQYWLYQAFDAYVLDGKDLSAALADADQKAQEFQACAATITAPPSGDQEAAQTYLKEIGKCAVSIDPGLKPFFERVQ
jgi:ABC-type glycerol-3-phosphate transport system substrate-binding protein